MSVIMQTVNATACDGGGCEYFADRAYSKTVDFFKKDSNWKLERYGGSLLYFETTDLETGIKGVHKVLSDEEADFLEKGLKKATLNNQQKIFKIEVIIDNDTGDPFQVSIMLQDQAGKPSYNILWFPRWDIRSRDRKIVTYTHVENDGESYDVTFRYANGHFKIRPFDNHKMEDVGGYFGICNSDF